MAAFTRRRSKRCSGTMKSCGGRCPNCWKSCRRWWKCKITGRGNIPLPVILHLNRYYFLLFSVSNPSLNLMQSSHFMLQSCISNRSGFRITPTYGMPRSLQISITSRRFIGCILFPRKTFVIGKNSILKSEGFFRPIGSNSRHSF